MTDVSTFRVRLYYNGVFCEIIQEYYTIAEYATPLLSMFEMEKGEISGLTTDAKTKHRQMFSDQLTEILHNKKHEDLQDSFCFLKFTGLCHNKWKNL